MNYMFLTSGEVDSKVNELLAEHPTYRKVKTAIDSRCKIENSDAFSRIVGNWTGETPAIAIEDEDGQIVDTFAFWENGSEELTTVIDNYKVSIYITEDVYYINFHAGCGWGEYRTEDYTLANALVDQYFAGDDEQDEEHERVYEIAKHIEDVLQQVK